MGLRCLLLSRGQAIFWLEILALLAAAHSTLQLLGARELWSPEGLLSWRVVRSYRRVTSAGALARVLDRLFQPAAFTALLALRLGAALLALALPTSAEVETLAVPAILVTSALVMLRLFISRSGGDQLCLILFGALFCRVLGGRTPVVTEACLWFVALQACLAYFGAGVAKLRSPLWRSGEAVRWVVNSRLWGHPGLARLLCKRPYLFRWLAWVIMVPECLFPLILVVGRPAGYLFLLWGVALHLSLGVVMGVNVFPLPFFATYPALLYVLGRAGGVGPGH